MLTIIYETFKVMSLTFTFFSFLSRFKGWKKNVTYKRQLNSNKTSLLNSYEGVLKMCDNTENLESVITMVHILHKARKYDQDNSSHK